MTDEKAKEVKAEVKVAPKTEQDGQKSKNKKVSRMTFLEVEQGLKKAMQEMGGHQSNFARHLLARKKAFSNSK